MPYYKKIKYLRRKNLQKTNKKGLKNITYQKLLKKIRFLYFWVHANFLSNHFLCKTPNYILYVPQIKDHRIYCTYKIINESFLIFQILSIFHFTIFSSSLNKQILQKSTRTPNNFNFCLKNQTLILIFFVIKSLMIKCYANVSSLFLYHRIYFWDLHTVFFFSFFVIF